MALVLKPGEGNKDSVVVEDANVEGLFQFSTYHIIKQSEAQFIYTGPKIPKDQWEQMLAFFKWTYDTHHSESQVRLYVNREENTWKIWAFPQESKTGMTARELDNEDMKRQQEQFGPEWMSFGTVHHHCNGSAFQSGVDENNEKDKTGLHVTIGSLGGAHYDMHARFYRNGRKFTEFPLSWFWDVTDEINDIPTWAWEALPKDSIKDFGHKIARYQMTLPAGPDVTFPEQWRQNVIDVTPPVITYPGFGNSIGGNGGSKKKRSSLTWSRSCSQQNDPLVKRCSNAWEDILAAAFYHKHDSDTLEICLSILNKDETIESIMAFACYRHKIDPRDLKRYRVSQIDLDDLDHDLEEAGVITTRMETNAEATGSAPAPVQDPKTTTTTRGKATTNQVMGMSDDEFADYQMRMGAGGID